MEPTDLDPQYAPHDRLIADHFRREQRRDQEIVSVGQSMKIIHDSGAYKNRSERFDDFCQARYKVSDTTVYEYMAIGRTFQPQDVAKTTLGKARLTALTEVSAEHRAHLLKLIGKQTCTKIKEA